MFDHIPVRVWLLVGIGALAYAPAHYIFRHLTHSLSHRDITQPAEDLSWRSSRKLALNGSILAGLLALAIFVFTPAAVQFAHAPSFIPLLLSAAGAWALFSVPKGLVKGQIEPFVRGLASTYERDSQPKRYWASIIWNGIVGSLCLGIAYAAFGGDAAPPRENKCYDGRSGYSPDDRIKTCNQLIAANSRDSRAYLERGLIFLDSMKLDSAVADFTRAHELDPKSPWPLADRGISYAWKSDRERAAKDFEVVRAIDPANPVVFRGQALLDMEAGNLEAAIDGLNTQLARQPNDIWSLRLRSDAYQQLGDFAKARADRDKSQQLQAG